MSQRIETADLAAFRANFPALANKAYFNFGGQGTMPRQALDAINGSYEFVQREGPFSSRMFKWLEDEQATTKQALAEEFGVAHETFALTQNATEGCNIAMWGVDWQKGDHLLLSDSEHPGVVAIGAVLAKRRGIEVTHCRLSDSGADALEAVRAALKSTTKMVALSHVLWNTGRVLPIAEIARLCRERGIWLLVDGAQSAGVLPMNFLEMGADFYAITGHKWMCGPEGVGALYVRKELIDKLAPTFVGWRGVELISPEEIDATRFEVATAAFPLLAGLRESLQTHRRFGPAPMRYEAIKRNALYLMDQLANGVAQLMQHAKDPAGLVSFALPGKSHADVAARLEAQHILVRTIPYPDCLRASVHYFSTQAEIDRLVTALKQA